MPIRDLLIGMFQKKTYTTIDISSSSLSRCLTKFDLTALGIGSTLGAGVYVVTGEVAKDSAGPGVVLSFLIAAFASILAGLCYAEFGARVPRTGSAYVYSYVSVGELMAFIIGWNLILEYVIGTASVARAWTANLDEVTGGHIQTFFNANLRMDIPGLAPYADFFAFFIIILLTIILSIGVKESSRFNNIFTVLNIVVILFTVIAGCLRLNIKNWEIPPSFVNGTQDPAIGSGHFLPFGMSGVLTGAATCFYAFVGFDAIATTGEEVINPQKAIPFGIIVCLLVCFVAYASVSCVVTLMCPFYLINPNAPLPFIFKNIGWTVPRYIVGFGAVFGLSTSLLGALFPLPRIIYAMASDGLIFKCLAKVNKRFKTPILATAVSGLFGATMAAIFDLKDLVHMMSIGTLLAYTLVAFAVLMLRGSNLSINVDENFVDSENSDKEGCKVNLKEYMRNLVIRRSRIPTVITDFITKVNTYCLIIVIIIFDLLVVQEDKLTMPEFIALLVIVFLIILFICITLFIQPESPVELSFKVPFVPWLPAISMAINLYLMMKLPIQTWYRFGIWMIIGFMIYFFYGICHSEQRRQKLEDENTILINTT